MVNPNEIIYSRRNADGTAFVEKALVPIPNYFVICGPCGDLTTWTGSFTGGGGGTSLGTGSTYPFTASWAIDVVNGGGASLGTGSTYPFTASWSENSTQAISASYASSSLSSSSFVSTISSSINSI